MMCWPRLMRCTANIPPPIDDLHLAPGQRFRPSGANQPGAGRGVSGGLMRVFLSLLLMLALAACQLALPGRGNSDAANAAPVAGVTAAPGTIAGGPIAVTPLAAGPQADAAPPAVAPDAAKHPRPQRHRKPRCNWPVKNPAGHGLPQASPIPNPASAAPAIPASNAARKPIARGCASPARAPAPRSSRCSAAMTFFRPMDGR